MLHFWLRRAVYASAAVILLVISIGCSPGVCTVSGTVTYRGQPLQQGEITFTPADGIGPIAGAPITAGRYAVNDVKPGKKIVQISELPQLDFPKSTEELAKAAQQGARPAPPPPDLMPASAKGNGVTIDIQAGKQTRDFQLDKPDTK
jgi:hypothetical protein